MSGMEWSMGARGDWQGYCVLTGLLMGCAGRQVHQGSGHLCGGHHKGKHSLSYLLPLLLCYMPCICLSLAEIVAQKVCKGLVDSRILLTAVLILQVTPDQYLNTTDFMDAIVATLEAKMTGQQPKL